MSILEIILTGISTLVLCIGIAISISVISGLSTKKPKYRLCQCEQPDGAILVRNGIGTLYVVLCAHCDNAVESLSIMSTFEVIS
jgi:hypothetical protein